MEGGFPKEWESLTYYEDFGKGKKWENHVWVYQEYQKLKQKRQDSLDDARQSIKKGLLHNRIRARLAEIVKQEV